MIVQIYGLTTEDDVRAAVDAGIDHLGLAVDVPPADITVERAKAFVDMVPKPQKTTMLSTETTVEPILEKATAVGPDIVHICSETYGIDPDGVREIRAALSDDVEIEKSIEVSVDDPIAAAKSFDDCSDYLLVDSPSDDADIPGVGVTGETHDWNTSAGIVDAVDSPVILAGGLSPENVAEAISVVDPAGVDSYTQTSVDMRQKDPERVRAFVEAAKQSRAGTER